MLDFVYFFLWPLLATDKVAQSGEFTWRELLSVLGILLPIAFGFVLYLLRKRQEAESELRKQQLDELRSLITRAQKDADVALEKITTAVNAHLTHQNGCMDKYINKDTYKQDMEMQSNHVASMKATIDTLNTIMVNQHNLVTQLVKTLS